MFFLLDKHLSRQDQKFDPCRERRLDVAPRPDVNQPTSHLARFTKDTSEILTSYRENFTMHGLSKIFNGVLWEKLLWLAALLACLGVIFHFTQGFYKEYLRYDIRTEIRMKTSRSLLLPAITICKPDEFIDFVVCYKNKSLVDGSPCSSKNTLIDEVYRHTRSYVTPHKMFPNCVILNHFNNLKAHQYIRIRPNGYPIMVGFNKNVQLVKVYIHDQSDVALMDYEHFHIKQNYSLYIDFSDKQIFTRLPSPHPSNCSHGQYDDSILPPPYTINKCIYTCWFRKMISQCGAVPQHVHDYAPSIKKLLPKTQNRSDSDVRQCLVEAYHNASSRICYCRVSCSEMFIKKKVQYQSHDISYVGPLLHVRLSSNFFTEITEIPAYPPTKFVTDIGGWLGLFSGMSLLSLIEIVIFIFLLLATMCHKLEQIINARLFRRNQDH